MTVAVDKVSGRVVGQVLDETPMATLLHDPKARKLYFVLTGKGYTTIAAESVRLEETEDDSCRATA